MVNEGATIWARKTIDSDIFLKKPDKWFKIWFFIVTRVSYVKNDQYERGQGYFTYDLIQQKTGASASQIDHCLRFLKSAKQIATLKAKLGMVITVLNYALYQDLENYKSDTKSETGGETKAKQKRNSLYIYNKYNNNNNIDTNVSIQNEDKKNKVPDMEVDAILSVFQEVNGTISIDQKPRQWAYHIKKLLTPYLEKRQSTLTPSQSLRKFMISRLESDSPIRFNKLQTIYYHLRSIVTKNEKSK